MSKKTVLNDNYKGVVEEVSIPAEVHERSGKKYATFGTTVPIHVCTAEEIAELSKKTHHVCGIFTELLPAPLGELAFVRLDENTAEKVFINRSKRLVLTSSDGVLAQWRSAPTFESANSYMAGTPVVNASGELVSVVTVRRGNHYAVSNFEGTGGYFDTSEPWKVVDIPDGSSVYGDRSFPSRDELRDYVFSLPPVALSPSHPAAPVLHVPAAAGGGAASRVVLVASNGRQISHTYVYGAIATDLEYL